MIIAYMSYDERHMVWNYSDQNIWDISDKLNYQKVLTVTHWIESHSMNLWRDRRAFCRTHKSYRNNRTITKLREYSANDRMIYRGYLVIARQWNHITLPSPLPHLPHLFRPQDGLLLLWGSYQPLPTVRGWHYWSWQNDSSRGLSGQSVQHP
jgi:hypothetical protein